MSHHIIPEAEPDDLTPGFCVFDCVMDGRKNAQELGCKYGVLP